MSDTGRSRLDEIETRLPDRNAGNLRTTLVKAADLRYLLDVARAAEPVVAHYFGSPYHNHDDEMAALKDALDSK